MKQYVCVLMFGLACSFVSAQEAAPPTAPATPQSVPEVRFHPGVIWGGASFVDIRQFAAITCTTYTKTEDGSFRFAPRAVATAPPAGDTVPATATPATVVPPTGLGEITIATDGTVKGPGDKVSQVRKTMDYGEGFVFVHARLFMVFGIPIRWDDKAGLLTVAEVHRIKILDPGNWYQVVNIPQDNGQTVVRHGDGGTPVQICDAPAIARWTRADFDARFGQATDVTQSPRTGRVDATYQSAGVVYSPTFSDASGNARVTSILIVAPSGVGTPAALAASVGIKSSPTIVAPMRASCPVAGTGLMEISLMRERMGGPWNTAYIKVYGFR